MVTLLAVSGCGSSGGSASHAAKARSSAAAATSTAPSQASGAGGSRSDTSFARSADAICAKLNAQLANAQSGHISTQEIAKLAPVRAAAERGVLSELSKLTPPAQVAHDWHLLLAYRRTLANELVVLGQHARAKDVKAIDAIAASKRRVHQQLHDAATRARLKDCAQIG
jgi:hypothetical protein